MDALIFEKTDKGRREIVQRQHGLPARHRLLLLLVDGRQSDAELLAKTSKLDIRREVFADLLVQDFIHVVFNPGQQGDCPREPAAIAIETALEAAAEASNQIEDYLPVFAPVPTAIMLKSDQEQIDAVYNFYTDTIKALIGLRGFALQLKVERAATIEDLIDLREPYLDAILRARGAEVERGMRRELDVLLHMSDAAPQMRAEIAADQRQA